MELGKSEMLKDGTSSPRTSLDRPIVFRQTVTNAGKDTLGCIDCLLRKDSVVPVKSIVHIYHGGDGHGFATAF